MESKAVGFEQWVKAYGFGLHSFSQKEIYIMRTSGRVTGLFIWLGFLIFVGILLLLSASSRVGEHKSSTYGYAYIEFQDSWGGEIGVTLPTFYLQRVYTETTYNKEAKQYETVMKTADFSLNPQVVSWDTALNYGEQERGWLIFNAFETTSHDQYQLLNNTSYPGKLYVNLARPENANLIYNYHITVGDKQIELSPAEEPSLLLDNLFVGQKTVITLTYSTKGMDSFRYKLSDYQNRVVKQLHAHLSLNTSDFQIYRFGLPHVITPTAQGAEVTFAVNDFATVQDLGITFASKQMYLDQIEAMMSYSPASLILYLLVILVFSQIQGVKFHGLHYLFIAMIIIFYFLFVAYLVRFVSITTTFALATALTTGMFFAYCPNVFGWKFSRQVAGPYLFGLTVIYSFIFLMPIFRGLLFVTLIFLICISIMISISRSDISQWAIVKGD